MTKYIYGAVIIALVLLGLWVNNLVDTNIKLKAEKKENLQTISNLEGAAKSNLAQALKDNAQSLAYLHKLEELQNEADIRNACITNGTCVVRIKATCPQLPNIEPNTTGATNASPELTEDARAGYIDLVHQIEITNLLVSAMKKRIAEDYEKCGAKAEKVK